MGDTGDQGVGREEPHGISPTQRDGSGSKGKSCKGCLYYSSLRKSSDGKPICIGVSRTLKQVPGYIVGESEMEAAKEGRNLSDFKYACLGYSVFVDNKENASGKQDKPVELPFCVGIELLVDKRVAHSGHTPAPAHNKEDVHGGLKPINSAGQEFLNRFTRNAGLVASGVAKNLNKAGNYVKATLDDILYPYRRR